jgi:cytidine deaminase
MVEDLAAFERAIGTFPREVSAHLVKLPHQRGALPAPQVQQVQALLGTDIPQLMIRLLPVAAAFGRVPVSNFDVGVVAAGSPTPTGAVAFYLGANFEVAGGPLDFTVHAEQVATINAWSNGEAGLSMLAASAAPCGYCRQFLCELHQAPPLRVVRPVSTPPGYSSVLLSDLLPDAFIPAALGNQSALMATKRQRVDLRIVDDKADPLAETALHAAQQSYSPYSLASAGCAVGLTDGTTFVGSSVESAAYNPSVPAVKAAFAMMNMSQHRGRFDAVTRVVLVEHATATTQRLLTQSYVAVLAPRAAVSYYAAERSKP